MTYVYFQRRQAPSGIDWQTRVIAITMDLVNEIRDISNVILSIESTGEIEVIVDTHDAYKGREPIFMASLLTYANGMADGAELMIIKHHLTTPDPSKN